VDVKAREFDQILGDGEAALIVEAGAGDGGPVDLGL
jgi:hypothetical protein